jgi:peroxiredoxin
MLLIDQIMIRRNLTSLQIRKSSLKTSCKRLIATVIFLFVISLLNLSVAQSINVQPGDVAPDFTLNSVEDEAITLSTFRGTIVVLLYFKTEQARSLEAMKEIQGLFGKYRSKGIQVVGVTAEAGERESILKIARENNLDFPILVDSERDVYGNYGIRVYPSTVIIDREGSVAYTIPGHALSYKIKMDGRFRYLLGEISEEELKTVMSPKREVKDDALLKAQRRYNLALKFTSSRMNDQAVMMVKQSIMAKADFAKSHILLGFLLIEEGEADEAHDAFRKALDITPDSKDAKTGLGSALIEKGELDKAIEILTEAASLNPNAQRTFYELGKAYHLKGDVTKSAEMYKIALEKLIHKHILPSTLSRCK